MPHNKAQQERIKGLKKTHTKGRLAVMVVELTAENKELKWRLEQLEIADQKLFKAVNIERIIGHIK